MTDEEFIVTMQLNRYLKGVTAMQEMTEAQARRIAHAAILEQQERDALVECERLGQRDAARDARRRHADAQRALAALIREAEGQQ